MVPRRWMYLAAAIVFVIGACDEDNDDDGVGLDDTVSLRIVNASSGTAGTGRGRRRFVRRRWTQSQKFLWKPMSTIRIGRCIGNCSPTQARGNTCRRC